MPLRLAGGGVTSAATEYGRCAVVKVQGTILGCQRGLLFKRILFSYLELHEPLTAQVGWSGRSGRLVRGATQENMRKCTSIGPNDDIESGGQPHSPTVPANTLEPAVSK